MDYLVLIIILCLLIYLFLESRHRSRQIDKVLMQPTPAK